MNYPLISEYVEAIRSAEDNFDRLGNLRPVLDEGGNPVMSSGNFAVVFKMKDTETGKLYAVKCFTKEQEGREEAYRQITDELEFVQSPYLAWVKYCERELFVDTDSSADSEFPVLLMDWVDGTTLDRYVRLNLHDKYALEMLAYHFSRLAMWLLPQPFAHGDLKPDNILVRPDGSLTLVDYDGMFVPAMQGQKSRELGSPDFRHPLRTADDFNEHIDDFPAVSILLSLRLLAADPSLLDAHGAADRLLFAENDYRDLSSCRLLKAVFPSQDAELNTLTALFAIASAHKTLAHVSFRLLAVAKPQKPEEELSTEVTDEDRENAVEDEFGVKYSLDGKRLLEATARNEATYKIKEGTKIICDDAFNEFNAGNWQYDYDCPLQQILIPDSVTSIGNNAFYWCSSLQQITIPKSVKRIGNNPFSNCKCKVICNSPHFRVVDDVLYDADMTVLISFLSDAETFAIPKGVKDIGNDAFSRCRSLQQITIPDSVTNIGNGAFYDCGSLLQISIPNSVTSIGNYAFDRCSSLQQISIPQSVKRIGDNPFAGCKCKVICNSPHFVDDVLYNADMTVLISFLSDAETFAIPKSVTSIGNFAFYNCQSLHQISIPNDVTSIGNYAFYKCSSLQLISIPNSVKIIGNHAFGFCESLRQISIPDGVKSIAKDTFSFCKSLRQIFIPDSVTSIGDEAFCCCESLHQIRIPKGSRAKFEQLLPWGYKDKLVEV